MNRPLNELNKKTSLAIKLFLASTLMATTSAPIAKETDKNTNKGADIAYVDSVFKWGAWELDIEPAAGGISAPTSRPLNARGTKVVLRTNSIAALAPPAPDGAKPSNPIVPGTPVPQPPAIPALPSEPPTPTVPTAPTTFAPAGATPPTIVTLPSTSPPAPPAPTSPAPSGAVTATVVTLP